MWGQDSWWLSVAWGTLEKSVLKDTVYFCVYFRDVSFVIYEYAGVLLLEIKLPYCR